jgi:hypothetical protein
MQGFTSQGQPKRNWMFLDSNAGGGRRIAGTLHHPTFSFRLVETQLERREYNGEDELYEVLDGILTSLSIKMIKTLFVDWMNLLHRLVDGNGEYISENIRNEFLNSSKQ